MGEPQRRRTGHRFEFAFLVRRARRSVRPSRWDGWGGSAPTSECDACSRSSLKRTSCRGSVAERIPGPAGASISVPWRTGTAPERVALRRLSAATKLVRPKMSGYSEQAAAFPPGYLRTLARQIRASPYFTAHTLNRDFVGTRGF